jgi:hypothetical protein
MEPNETEMALRAEVTRLANELEQSREVAREEAERAEARRNELRLNYDERMTTLRERWQTDSDTKQARIDELLETEAGKAWVEVEEMKRQVTRAEEFAERYKGRMTQAESDRDRALASVAGGEDIHPADPRVAHIWRKASRLATANQFCSEYDKIAEALGLPEVKFDYSGYVSVRVSAYVSVPVSGTATRRQIADGDIADEVDTDDILQALDSSDIEYDIDEVNVEADDE